MVKMYKNLLFLNVPNLPKSTYNIFKWEREATGFSTVKFEGRLVYRDFLPSNLMEVVNLKRIKWSKYSTQQM